jgi:hypothetical protein
MNNLLKNWLKENSITAIVITVLTIVLGLLFSELQTKLGWLTLLISIIIIFSIIFVVLWLSFKNVLSVNQQLASNIDSSYKQLIDKYQLGWLFSSQQLYEIEATLSDIEIWLVTADLGEDKIGGFFQNCVTDNLNKGNVVYHYFVPDRLDIKAKVEQLKCHNQNSPNLKFTFLNDDFFFLVPKFDFSIYNPLNHSTNLERLAFMGVPAKEEEHQYHVKISDDITDVLIGKLLKILNI